jgi:ABC-2 type transport system permease protein
MNTQSNAIPESHLESQSVVPAAIPATRLLYWSVRRELWENRSIYIAPLAAAAIFLFGFMISVMHLPARMRAATQGPTYPPIFIENSYMFAALVIMGTTFIVAVFYCLDALHGERRDRSILFWKSLPVSDLTTVLSKASIPIVILPLLTFAMTIALWFLMLLLSSAVLLASGLGIGALRTPMPLFGMSLMLLYHLVGIHALWYAPIYGWLLMVSSWARRAAFLWATLPPLAIGVVEKIAFNTSYFANMVGYQFGGGELMGSTGSRATGIDALLMPRLTLGQFVTNPSLWTGLVVAAAFLVAAARVRHNQGPI